jgi:hypothetical protein
LLHGRDPARIQPNESLKDIREILKKAEDVARSTTAGAGPGGVGGTKGAGPGGVGPSGLGPGSGGTGGGVAAGGPSGWTGTGGQPAGGGNQPRSVRNNNPGNIIDGSWAKSQPGCVGTDGHFAKFDTPEHGFAAMSANLRSYGRQGINTPSRIISKWAPAADNNNPVAYAATVGKNIGIDPNAPLDMNDPETLRKVGQAIASVEGSIPLGDVPKRFAVQPGGASSGGGTASNVSVQSSSDVIDHFKELRDANSDMFRPPIPINSRPPRRGSPRPACGLVDKALRH